MDFRLTDKQMVHRKEFFDVCKELDTKKPSTWVGMEPFYETDECWEFQRHCGKEFAKRGWLALDWPAEYGGKGEGMLTTWPIFPGFLYR